MSSLTSFDVSENNPYYTSKDGVLFSKDMTELIRYPPGKSDKEYVIPDGVTTFWGYAFFGCSELQSVVLPSTVFGLFLDMFQGCSKLSSITYKGTKNLLCIPGEVGKTKNINFNVPNAYESEQFCGFPTKAAKSGSKISTGAIVGIVIGCVVVVAIIVIVIVIKKRSGGNSGNSTEME